MRNLMKNGDILIEALEQRYRLALYKATRRWLEEGRNVIMERSCRIDKDLLALLNEVNDFRREFGMEIVEVGDFETYPGELSPIDEANIRGIIGR